MKIKINTRKYIGLCIASMLSCACNKTAFLNAKPQQSQIVPTSLADFQALLDNDGAMNGYLENGVDPGLGEIGTNDYYTTDAYFTGNFTLAEQNEYIWAANPYPALNISDWDLPYTAIFYANEALVGIATISPNSSNQAAYNNVVGSACFFRAMHYFAVAQVFCPAYDSTSAKNDLGLPLRLSADINEKLQRATVEATYNLIISDAQRAIPLLPVTPLYGTRPGRPAAYGLLARVYLSAGDYKDAGLYADSSLQLYSTLMDYNTLDTTQAQPIAQFNAENLISCIMVIPNQLYYGYVDTTLLSTYDSNDLRPVVFYTPAPAQIKCTYDGSYNFYTGIATDEMYLTRAECRARLGDLTGAMSDINTLLIKRYQTGTFINHTAISIQDAVKQILSERRKELIYRGLRWSDLRRLNKEGAAIGISRYITGQTYTLAPNDPRWVWPIPDNVLSFNPGMQQNPR